MAGILKPTFLRRHRLSVRTSPFQGGKAGSTPAGAAICTVPQRGGGQMAISTAVECRSEEAPSLGADERGGVARASPKGRATRDRLPLALPLYSESISKFA